MVGTFVAHMMLVGRRKLDPQAGTVYNFLHDYWKDAFPPEVPIGELLNHGEKLLALPLWLLK